MRTALLSLLGLAPLANVLTAQCPLVQDINAVRTPFDGNPGTGRVGEGSSYADGMLQCGAAWYLVAETTGTGRELWKTDGIAAGTVLVKDIDPGSTGSDPFWLACCNGKVFFRAKTGTHGDELWVSDGTAAGTVMVKDIRTGSASSNPSNICCLGNKVLFTATDGSSGFELWISDGTAAGTMMLKDIQPGSLSGSPQYLKRNLIGTGVYFQADDGANGKELWITDGTAAGTKLLRDIQPGAGSSSPTCFIDNPSQPLQTLFSADNGTNGLELWKTDGTAAGTVMVKDIQPGALGSALNMYHSRHSALAGFIYFSADDGTNGSELWKSNGTATGTMLVQDINPGLAHSDPTMFRISGNTLYMQACTAQHGCELFQLSGNRVSLVQDILRGTGSSSPSWITRLQNGSVVFAADTGATGSGIEPWISDGTSAGTMPLGDIWAGTADSKPDSFTVFLSGARVLFFAKDGADSRPGRELYQTDGTAAGTGLLKDLYPGGTSNSSSPNFLTSSQGRTLFFSADDGVAGREPWKADAAGAARLLDLHPGPGSSDPSGFIDLWTGSRLVTLFRADDGTSGSELWVTDGTAAGTRMLKDIDPGAGSSKPSNFGRFRGRVYFAARTASAGYELWATDGTAAGTVLVRDIDSGSGSSSPHAFTAHGNALYFVAFVRSVSGIELWKTDGTAAGTVLVKDIRPGTASSSPLYLTPFGNVLLFQANDGPGGVELWRTDGTPQGTAMVKDIAPGSFGGNPAYLVRFGNAVYFSASDNSSGFELWKTDGTANGTVIVKDIQAGSSSSRPGLLTLSQGRLFFRADDGKSGTELFVSDGSAAGTGIVKDLYSGPFGSSPTGLVAAGDGVYFTADDGSSGREPHFSDGTAAGTVRVCDLNPGQASSHATALIACDGRLYFSANTALHGSELFRIGGNPGLVESFGASCGSGTPTLDATQPVLGRNCRLSGTGPTTGLRLLMLGVRNKAFSIQGLIAPDCTVWQDLRVSVMLPLPPVRNWSAPVPIPNQVALIGARAVLQSVHGVLPLSLSNTLQLTVGN